MNINYYFLVFSQQYLLENEVIEETIRERSNYYITQNKKNDFWISISPNFLKEKNLNNKIKNTNYFRKNRSNILLNEKESDNEYYAVIISNNLSFIDWLKLRLGDFEILQNDNSKISKNDYTVSGIYGEILNSNIVEDSFKSNINLIHPDLITKKLNKSLRSLI